MGRRQKRLAEILRRLTDDDGIPDIVIDMIYSILMNA